MTRRRLLLMPIPDDIAMPPDPPGFDARDTAFMQQALRLAAHARDVADEVPVGAVMVLGDAVIGEGWNRNIALADPTAHAEIVALRAACHHVQNHRLPPDTTLYVTLEPCAMCAMALVHARVTRVVYAAADPRTGAAGSVFDTLISDRHNHRIQVRGGLCADAAAALLRDFFRTRR